MVLGKRFSMTGVMILGLALTGCPDNGPATFEVWVINTSDTFTISSVKVLDPDTEDTMELVTGSGVSINSIGVFTAITVGDLDGDSVEITVAGSSSKGIEAESTVIVPDLVMNGVTIPVIVAGETSLTFDADYIPLDENAKLRRLLQ